MKNPSESALAQTTWKAATKGTSLLLAASLVASSCPYAWANEPNDADPDLTKDEIVYVKADAYGSTEGIHVVNVFPAGAEERILDPARYESVANLTTTETLEVANGAVELTTLPERPFYYQGNMRSNTELPWDISLSYYIGSEEVSASEVAGASGEVSVKLDVAPKDGDFSESFFIQAQGTFPSDSFRVISAEGASVARVGNNVVVTGLVLPGDEASLCIQGQVSNFSYAGWQISAVPLSLVIDLREEDTSELSAMADQLEGGTAALAEGTSTLDEGMGQLAMGAGELASGTRLLTDGVEAFRNGEEVARLVDLASMASELGSLIGNFTAGADSLLSTWEALLKGADELLDRAAGLEAALDAHGDGLELASAEDALALQSASEAAALDYQSAEEAYQRALSLIGENPTHEDLAEIDSAVKELGSAAEEYRKAEAAYREALASEKASASANALNRIVNEARGLIEAANSICAMLHDCEKQLGTLLDAANELIDIAKGLSSELSGIEGDVETIMRGVDELSAGAATIADGSLLLYDSLAQAKDGTEELNFGANQLASAVVGLDDKVLDELQKKIDEKLGAGYVPHSFVAPENENVNVVQFAYVVDGISAKEGEAPQSEPEPETQPTILSRLVALFTS